jgi:hypothetical protein
MINRVLAIITIVILGASTSASAQSPGLKVEVDIDVNQRQFCGLEGKVWIEFVSRYTSDPL